MGVSNTFGSNVFDLLVGLALPWFSKALASGEAVHINSNGLMYDSVLLLGIVGITVRNKPDGKTKIVYIYFFDYLF
jgi:Ca2+/Na+ antiporter